MGTNEVILMKKQCRNNMQTGIKKNKGRQIYWKSRQTLINKIKKMKNGKG